MTKLRIAICVGIVIMLAGCAEHTSRIEMDYGTSQKLAIANQTLQPDAGKNLDPVQGLDSPAGQKAYDRYTKGFEKQESQPAPVYLLNVGSTQK